MYDYHITHGDLDGCGCRIILGPSGYVNKNTKQITVNRPNDLPQILLDIIQTDRDSKKRTILITDLSIDMGTVNMFTYFGHVDVIDHHVTDSKVIEAMDAMDSICVIDTSACATLLCAKVFCPEDQEMMHFAELVDKRDRFTDPRNRDSLDLMYAHRILGQDEFAEKVMSIGWQTTVREVRQKIDRLKAKDDTCFENGCRFAVSFGVGDLSVSFVFADCMISDIGHWLCDNGADVAVLINVGYGGISFRSKGFDCVSLARYMGGNGHTCAAGAPLPDSRWIEDPKGCIRELIEKIINKEE